MLPCQLSIHIAIGIESVIYATTFLLVQDDLEKLAAVLTSANALTNDLDRVDNVGEDGIVNGG